MKHYLIFLLILFSSHGFAQSCGDLQPYSPETASNIYAAVTSPSFNLQYKDAENGCNERADKINQTFFEPVRLSTWTSKLSKDLTPLEYSTFIKSFR